MPKAGKGFTAWWLMCDPGETQSGTTRQGASRVSPQKGEPKDLGSTLDPVSGLSWRQ